MDLSFYTAAVGAEQQQQRLNVQANNIANINTYGYKAEKPSFSSLMYNNVTGMNDTQLPRGSGTEMVMADTDFSGGPISTTGRSQDYAIEGDGFFGLYDPATKEVSYTRDGSFTISEFQRNNADGNMENVAMLSDGDGRFVLSNQGRLLTVTDLEAEQPVGVFDFSSTDGMLRMGDNRFVPVAKNGQVRFGTGKARRGALEVSNADLAEQITKVIEAQRSFSYVLRMVQTSDELESTANNLRS
ncbi:MAG: flagellar hook basal-body protein [Intestinimonas sp.]|nr:flagellar hook basal-body protein [Intestinimonas sp.]